ncbi:hypothetical protein EHM92_00065 [bacterium]|nr:MAG: hypothetical protein EHM92_00065 [bacterium]
MGAHIEWLEDVETGVLRIGREFRKHGDPYELACTVIRKGDVITLVGASCIGNAQLIAERESMRAILAPLGIRKIRWRRIKGDKCRDVEIEVAGPNL